MPQLQSNPRCPVMDCRRLLQHNPRFGLVCPAHPPIAKCGRCGILIGPTYLYTEPIPTPDGIRCADCAEVVTL